MAVINIKPSDLQKIMEQHAKQLCELMANEVYEAVNFFLNQYYEEWTPVQYQRSYDMLHSAFKTNVKKVGNSFVAEVGIDYESLDNYKDATGYDVVTWANNGLHGGMNVGTNTKVWDDAIEETIGSGQLLLDCIAYLKSKGFTVYT
jgi:hypothetical protein